MKRNFFYLALVGILLNCQPQQSSNNEIDDKTGENLHREEGSINEDDWGNQKENIRTEIINLIDSYFDAIRELDSLKIVDHYLKSQEFAFFENGQTLSYKDLIERVGIVTKSFSTIELSLNSIQVKVLNNGVAVAFMSYDQLLTDKEGNQTPISGEATWIAVRDENQWKLAYAQGCNSKPSEGN